tara:strand:- start:18424 stop:19086 length:663 start_codon:yes stop_codon:yes gene_type:complete
VIVKNTSNKFFRHFTFYGLSNQFVDYFCQNDKIMLSKISPKISIIFFAVFAVAMTRIIPHWPNVTAVAAIAIFGGATLRNSLAAVLIPLSAIFFSDIIINNVFYAEYYDEFVFFGASSGWIYAAFILMTVLAHVTIRSFKALPIIGTTALATILFYVLTNFGAWLYSPLYSQDLSGLMLSFEAGLPFVLNSLLSNLFFVGVFFYGYSIATEKKVSWLFVK